MIRNRTGLLLSVFILLIAAMMFGACSKTGGGPPIGGPVGGPCQYVDIPGMAKVVSVEEPPSAEYNCANAVKVTFDFVPNNPAAIDDYRFPSWEDTGNHFTVSGGMNPPKKWVLEQGLTEGSEHACVRSEITKGTCTPVIFSFPEIIEEGWEEECFER